MKKSVLLISFILVLSITQFSYAQEKKDLIGTWEGGEAFSGEYKDKKLEIEFTDSKFIMRYGASKYQQYDSYVLEDKILTITRRSSNAEAHRPKFKVLISNSRTLLLEAMNWPAVYITAILTSPYQSIDEGAFLVMDDTDLSAGGMFSIHLDLSKKRKK